MGGYFDFEEKTKEIAELESKTLDENFWKDVDLANGINSKINKLKKELSTYKNIKEKLKDCNELIDIIQSDEDFLSLSNEIDILMEQINELETNVILSDEFDDSNCYLEIHPGAGGTESCDWASMLLRMYEKYSFKNGYKFEVIDENKGDEAGIKSVTVKISGLNAYGILKLENGVHRLVRISPFDASKRRHTSFASVIVTPEINKKIDIDIKESDLKIDVYHSSGAGGQSVNTSNSAVRITHLPSKIVVTCQNERSQLKNKEQALKMLKNKLYISLLEKQEAEANSYKDTSSSVEFGNQIRSYILEPYKLVKDHRSLYENTSPEKILDGDIKDMLTFNLKHIL